MKIIPKSRLVNPDDTIDSVKRMQTYGRNNYEVLLRAQRCWDGLFQFRKDRERCKRYTMGNQWGDPIKVGNKTITEEEYLYDQGSVPLKNNLIRKVVRTVVSSYRASQSEPVCIANDRDEQMVGEMMTTTLQCNWKLNKMGEMNTRMFEEFLISGAIFQKETFGWRNGKKDCWTDMVDPRRIFFDGRMSDVRHWDCTLIGEIHDIPFESLVSDEYGIVKSPEDYHHLREVYSLAANKNMLSSYYQRLLSYGLNNIDFFAASDTGLCRIFEVWSKETKPRFRCHDYLKGEEYKDEISNEKNIKAENDRRVTMGLAQGLSEDDIPLIEYEWFVDSYWYYRILTPFGEILAEGETPYEHESHPYTMKVYPFIDGEVHSFVSDIIDQQRYVNRMITLNDFIIRASAKGVLLIPDEGCIPEGHTIEEIAAEWVKPNGVIAFKAKPGVEIPRQIANNSTDIGIYDMLNLQIKLMEDISGANGAMQGKDAKAGTASSLYAQQAQNAATTLVDLTDSFKSFVEDGAMKKVKNMQQFYTERRIVNIAGSTYMGIREYLPEKAIDIDFDLSLTEATSSPSFRMIANDFLLQIWQSGQISLEQLLQFGHFPFGEQLLQSLNVQKEQIAQGQMPGAIDPQIVGQIQQNVNPEAQRMLRS